VNEKSACDYRAIKIQMLMNCFALKLIHYSFYANTATTVFFYLKIHVTKLPLYLLLHFSSAEPKFMYNINS